MDTLQLRKAEYGGTGAERCAVCGQPLGPSYYRVKGKVACERCGAQAKSESPADSHSAFVRGVLFGVGGAIAGLITYAVFAITTGLVIGYVSLAVGYIVGKAIKFGAGGFGGRRYQIAAVLLTYAAVSLAAVPIAISFSAKQRQVRQEAAGQRLPTVAETGSSSAVGPDTARDADQVPSTPRQARPNPGAALLQLLAIGLASPFLDLANDPFHGGIGLIILLVGIRIAWQVTAGSEETQIVGPFRNPAAANAPPALG